MTIIIENGVVTEVKQPEESEQIHVRNYDTNGVNDQYLKEDEGGRKYNYYQPELN